MRILGIIAALFAVGTFWGHELLSVLILAWLVLVALGIFILVAWVVGHVVCTVWEQF